MVAQHAWVCAIPTLHCLWDPSVGIFVYFLSCPRTTTTTAPIGGTGVGTEKITFGVESDNAEHVNVSYCGRGDILTDKLQR